MVSRAISRSKNIDIVRNFLSMAVVVQSSRSDKDMEVEYPSLKPYWLSDNNVTFSMYLSNPITNNFCSIFEN